MIHVFIVGSKGIPARYGGFETFVENLTAGKENKDIFYHVSCMNNDEKHFDYNGADCFNVKLPLKGAKGRILHVSRVLSKVEEWKKNNMDLETVVYILGCRIGPLLIPHAKVMRKMGIKILVNPDGLEWKRNKWNRLEKNILKYCERCLVMNSDLVICDSLNIEKYIQKTYHKMRDKTVYIAYGADAAPSKCADEVIDSWLNKNRLEKDNYYLVVGRFVPENNYETIILEYMRSTSKKPLVIISNIEKNKFYQDLVQKTYFEKDERVRFVGTVYDKELLKKIREYAFAYIHGHEVGGTNPSLLEALASTKLNLLLDVGFNREVADDGAIYWNKKTGNMKTIIEMVERINEKQTEIYKNKAKSRIVDDYDWKKIIEKTESMIMDVVIN